MKPPSAAAKTAAGTARHIMVLDPALKVAELECFNRLVHAAPELRFSYHLPAMFGMTSVLAENLADVHGLLILGSAGSVHDQAAWQQSFQGWLSPRLAAGLPTLGICYGHQLIAYLLGGKVDYLFADQHKLVGWRETRLAATSCWPAATGALVVSHCEAVTQLPPTMHAVATSDDCAIDGMAHYHLPIWTLQAHPEAAPGFVDSHGISLQDPAHSLTFGHSLVQGFLRYVAGR